MDTGDASQGEGDGKKTPWRLLALLIAMTAVGPVSLNVMVPALPRLSIALGSDIATVQLTLSLFLLSLATAQLLVGPLSDLFGRRPVVLGGLLLATLASFAAAAATSAVTLIVARIVQALGASVGIVVGRAIVRDLFASERAAAMLGLVTTAMVLGPMLAPTIGGLLDTAFGWQSIFLFVAAFSLTVLVWAAFALPETRSDAQSPASALRHDWQALAVSHSFYGYVAAQTLGTIPFFVFIGGGPHAVITVMGRASAEYGAWFGLTSLGYMTGNFIASRISQRVGIRSMILTGLTLECCGAGLMVATTLAIPDYGPAVIFLPQILISLGNGIMLPSAVAGAISVRPHASGSAAGLAGFMQWAVGAAAAQVVTIVLAGATTALPMALMIVVSVAGAFVAFVGLVRR